MSDNNSADSNASSNSRKHWKDYDADELRLYCLSNWDKTDCSFLLMDSEEVTGINLEDSKEVVESFQWMLCDISPKLKEILSKEENQAKGCKEIEIHEDVDEAENFEYILLYAHTKKLEIDPTYNIDFVTLYEVARKYEVDELAKMVIEVAIQDQNVKEISWIALFKKAKMDHPDDDGWQEYFEKVMAGMSLDNKNWYLENWTVSILDFDDSTFDKFFDYIIRAELKPINCFHAAEIYLNERFFNGNSPKPLKGKMKKDIVNSYMEKIQFYEMNFAEFVKVFKSSLMKNIYSN